MKIFVTYFIAVILAFLGVTSLMIHLDEQYKNVWYFDFTPVSTPAERRADSLRQITDSLMEINKEPVFARETLELYREAAGDTGYFSPKINYDSLAALEEQAERERLLRAKEKSDSAYDAWKAETIRLYESMDPEQVAQVIQNFPDNVARDLIYSMRRKKAAEVLENLDEETVAELTKVER
jgi:flagellar motility protein MotE (MotC chaperone)